ncbi:unnamed protein product [Discula destructiva]
MKMPTAIPNSLYPFIACLAFLRLAYYANTAAVAAADLNDIIMAKSTDCNNAFDALQCTDVPADYCCTATMPFCHIAVYNKASIPECTTSAWANAVACDTSAPAPLYCENECTCLDASTPGETNAGCAALWSSNRRENVQADKWNVTAAEPGCRIADTLRYMNPEGVRMEIRGITEANFSDIMGHYHSGNYSQLATMAVLVFGDKLAA